MTKYLILSDIHGSELYLEAALTAQKDADVVVICGDLEFEVYDIEEIIRRHMSRSIDIRMVRGNCDAYFTSSSTLLDQISFPVSARHRALVTHGHLYRASYDLMTYAAMEKECDIVIGQIAKIGPQPSVPSVFTFSCKNRAGPRPVANPHQTAVIISAQAVPHLVLDRGRQLRRCHVFHRCP